MMSKRSSGAKLSAVHRRLQLLQSEVAVSSPNEKLASELADIEARMAELEVAYEELEQQNDELVATREALENQRHRYRDLFDRAHFGYLVTDANGVIEEANEVAGALLGVPRERLPAKPLALYLERTERTSLATQLSRLRGSDEAAEWRLMVKPRGREPFPALMTAVRDLDGQNRGARLRFTLHDLSEQEAAARALRESEERLRHSQRMETVGRLAGGIAHSFNNLLAAIAFQCELLCERLDGDERRAHVEEIQRSGERAATLARQLLAFGRKQVLQPRVLDLNEVIRGMEPMLRRLLGENIRLEARLDPAAVLLNADLGQLEQVILNLVVNARDAMPLGGCLLLEIAGVELTPADAGSAGLPPGPYVRLAVEDTGTGMPPEVMERLFEPFFTTKELGKGTGLGLATVHGIVHQSGGHIRAESEPEKGTRFTILLPRASHDAATSSPQPSRKERRHGRNGSEVVLLVEDEDNIRNPAVEILESRGYQVLSAADAAQALAVAERHRGPIHLLVTDVVMPGLSGSQLALKLAPLRPEMRLLYVSGYPEDAIAHHGVLESWQHFLQKPFAPGKFLDKVREVLDASVPARVG
jgi:two-component system, cell cycle sensor histidine kinase and response regulator CckA